jgi:hypothetical protein
MTMIAESSIHRKMGRKKLWGERLAVRFPTGTSARIDRVIAETEDRTDVIRTALERELRRREAVAEKRKKR